MAPKRYGNQKPRVDHFNNGDIWLAEKTIELLEEYGITLLPWQKKILRRWMALDEMDKWVNSECGLSVARQNGKTELMIARIIGGMVFLGEALIYTAQSQKTTDEIKRRVSRFFYDAKEELRNMLTTEFDKEPKTLDYLELQNGGRCVFNTRTRTGGLGSTSDTLLFDEGAELTDAQQEALLPTISAGKKQNHQVIYASMPPTSGSAGTVFKRIRENVLKGKAPGVCWQEWSVESITDPFDEDAWYNTNPSLGYYLMKTAVRKEAETMAIDSFNKMRLGWYQGVDGLRAISDDQWEPLGVKKVALPDNPSLVYAVKFSPDRSSVSLAVGVLMPDGKVHVEIVERKLMSYGTAWLAKWLLERWRKANKIIIDGAAGTQLLVEELVRSERKMSKRILTPNVREAGAAYASFFMAVENKELTHFNQPVLNLTIKVVKKRDIGKDGMFGFSSMNPDIQSDPVEAAAFAYYGAVRFGETKKTGASGQKVKLV